jgi:hypothetical protein
MADIPRRDRDLNAWLLERFLEKDKRLQSAAADFHSMTDTLKQKNI